jgi:hypothetical protein
VQVEEENGDGDGQHLFTVGSYRHCQGLMRMITISSRTICPFRSYRLTPVFLLAEKLTMFRPNAIMPLTNNAKAFSLVISVAP